MVIRQNREKIQEHQQANQDKETALHSQQESCYRVYAVPCLRQPGYQEKELAQAENGRYEVLQGGREEVDRSLLLVELQVCKLRAQFRLRQLAQEPHLISVWPCLLVRIPKHSV